MFIFGINDHESEKGTWVTHVRVLITGTCQPKIYQRRVHIIIEMQSEKKYTFENNNIH